MRGNVETNKNTILVKELCTLHSIFCHYIPKTSAFGLLSQIFATTAVFLWSWPRWSYGTGCSMTFPLVDNGSHSWTLAFSLIDTGSFTHGQWLFHLWTMTFSLVDTDFFTRRHWIFHLWTLIFSIVDTDSLLFNLSECHPYAHKTAPRSNLIRTD